MELRSQIKLITYAWVNEQATRVSLQLCKKLYENYCHLEDNQL